MGKIMGFLILILVVVIVGFLATFGLWLQTYRAFTARTLVAQVEVSELFSDENGPYMNVVYTPYEQQSALAHIFSSGDETPLGEPQEFKIYGDTVYIGAPTVVFHDSLIVLNFETIYKVATIYGRYDLDNEMERNRREISSFELNGGVDGTWRAFRNRQGDFPYNLFVNTVQMTGAGQWGDEDQPRIYNVYMTVRGFEWDEIGPPQAMPTAA